MKRRVAGSVVTGGPLVTTKGVYSTESLSSFFRYIISRSIMGLFSESRAGAVFAISPGIGLLVRRFFGVPKSKIRLLPLGGDVHTFQYSGTKRRELRESLGLSDDSTVVIYTGRIIPSKELHVLLSAVDNLSKQFDEMRLLVVTDDKKELNRLTSDLACKECLIHHPLVSHDELPGLFSAADIAVWPGSPSISIAEAVSVGLPVIVKKSPFTSYLLSNQNGFAFEGGNVDDLTRKLQILVEDTKLRSDMARQSRNLAERKLNWRVIAENFIRVYEEM